MRFEFPRTLGQDEAKQRLRRALESGRFPHALLAHGEPGLGQHALLLDLAQILTCTHPEARPCGSCNPCRLFESGDLGAVQYMMPIESKSDAKEDGKHPDLNEDQIEELDDLAAALRKDPYAYRPKGNAQVRIVQAHDLLKRAALSKEGAYVVLIPYLEHVNEQSANALLKILEEPSNNVYFLIASDHRTALLQTLLSRCVHLALAPLRPDAFRAAAETLALRAGKPGDAMATRLLPFAEGSPGAYLSLLENGGETLLDEALEFLAAARSDWRAFSDYASGIEGGAEGTERVTRLLAFLLRMLRAAQALRARHSDAAHAAGGESDGYRWTARALEAEGWDASLTPYLGVLEDLPDPQAFAAFLAEAHAAVRGFSKPSIALTGLFLEYEARVAASRATHPAGAR
jgi:DNA polymerase-3 subunit delta'